MYQNDPDTRFEAALRLAEVDPARRRRLERALPRATSSTPTPVLRLRQTSRGHPARASDALSSIAASDEFDPDNRFEAAIRLAEVDSARGAAAFRSIAASDEFDPDTRSEAAHRLAEVDPPPAEALRRPAPPAPRPPQAPRPPRPPR